MSDAIDVSVLVLAYNHEEFIGPCLRSILRQDFAGSMEILVGEDCSTDATGALIHELATEDARIRVVTSDKNVGMHANNRRLIARARGRFIAYCDGDDYWHDPSKLRVQLEALAENPSWQGVHSEVDHVVRVNGTSLRCSDYWRRVVGSRGAYTDFKELLTRNVVQTCSVVVRAESLRDYPDSPLADQHFAVEDWPMFLHVTAKGPLGVLTESLATYRTVDGSATQQGYRANHARILDQARLLRFASAPFPQYEHHARAGIRNTHKALLVNAVLSGDPELLSAVVATNAGPYRRAVLVRVVLLLSRAGLLTVASRLARGYLALRTRLMYR